MEHKDLPFPAPEESSSRYVKQRKSESVVPHKHASWNDIKATRPAPVKVETWRRILLVDCMQNLRTNEMPALLLDTIIDRVLGEQDRASLHQFLDTLSAEWRKD